jgi:hypothetical protein
MIKPKAVSEATIKFYASELGKAKRADKARQKEEGLPSIDRARAATGEKLAAASEVEIKTRELITQAQELFKGCAMRRTIFSKDNTGKPLWKAKDPVEVVLYLKLLEHERDALATLVDSSAEGTLDGFEEVSSFSTIRHAAYAVTRSERAPALRSLSCSCTSRAQVARSERVRSVRAPRASTSSTSV